MNAPAGRVAGGAWRPAACAAAVAAGLLGGAEVFWRARGVVPTVDDTPGLWALHRRAVPGAGEPGAADAVVLAGNSRMHVGFDVDLARSRWPGRHVAQLAIDGVGPAGVLEDLAGDEAFVGSVVVNVSSQLASASPCGSGPPFGLRIAPVTLSISIANWVIMLVSREIRLPKSYP